MHSEPQAIVERLANAPTDADAYNEYTGDDPNNTIRRANLLRYLQHGLERRPATLMVMEAPGYRGCRITGVPVTSRKILLEGIDGQGIDGQGVGGLFGADKGYQNTHDIGFERIYGEQSATIVWNTLADIGLFPFIWNTFPFHPHKPDQPLTNRKPRKAETELGATFLRDIIDLFAFKTVIAVGNVAHDTLTGMGVDCQKVRHPAQGGKNDFVAGLRAILLRG